MSICNHVTYVLRVGVFIWACSCMAWSIIGGINLARSYFQEVCDYPSINFTEAVFKEALESKLVGQPFVFKVVVPLLAVHMNQQTKKSKALVMSFHGTPGSGKNYAAQIIAESIYTKGLESKFVHLFKPVLHFANEPAEVLKPRIQAWIVGNVTLCKRRLFIFDEMDNMPEGVLDALKPFIDYSPHFQGVDFSESIFLFISNIATKAINQKILEFWRSGSTTRESLRLDELSNLILGHAFNENGGFLKSNLISSRLIDSFIPFIPLERRHVAHCIRKIASDYSSVPLPETEIETILSKVDYSPPELQLFATHGCKNLESFVKLSIFEDPRRITDEL